jgi:hypothetical protein
VRRAFLLQRGSPTLSGCIGGLGASPGLARAHAMGIHAYALMSNEVHRLARPATADSLSALMKAHGQRYLQSVNRRYRPGGPLCGASVSLLSCRDGLLLSRLSALYRSTPVRATMLSKPADSPVLSVAANSALDAGPGNHVPSACLGPGSTPWEEEISLSGAFCTRSGPSAHRCDPHVDQRKVGARLVSGSGHGWRPSRGAGASSPLPMRNGNCCSDGEASVVCGVFAT